MRCIFEICQIVASISVISQFHKISNLILGGILTLGPTVHCVTEDGGRWEQGRCKLHATRLSFYMCIDARYMKKEYIEDFMKIWQNHTVCTGYDTVIVFQMKAFGTKKSNYMHRLKSAICQFFKNGKMVYFLTRWYNLKFFCAKCLHLKCYESVLPDFIQNMSQAPFKCLSMWIKTDK